MKKLTSQRPNCALKTRIAIAIACLLCIVPAKATSTGFSIGLNFGSDEPDGAGNGALSATEVAGAAEVKQANWNNLPGGTLATPRVVVGDEAGVRVTNITTTVEFASPNTWSSTGRGEENNQFPAGPDRDLMTGYIDTGSATTTTVTIREIPSILTTNGYSVYVYMLGGVPNKGGGYRILNADDGAELMPYLLGDSIANPSSYIRDPGLTHQDQGNYLLFKGLTASNIVIEADTFTQGAGSNPRAPINAIQLAQVPDMLIIGNVQVSPLGIQFTIEDSGRAVLAPSSLVLKFDNVVVTPTSTSTADGVTTVVYNVATPPLASGSTHQVSVEAKDALNRTFTLNSSVTVSTFATIAANTALPAASVDKTKPGFIWNIHQVESATSLANSSSRADTQLLGQLGDNVADPDGQGAAEDVATPANPPNAPIAFNITNVINLNQTGGGTQGNITPDEQMPGIPGLGFVNNTDNIAAEILTAIEFPAAGLYTMIVNSDDGFKTTSGLNPRDAGATLLGAFEGGRGSADTQFSFFVPAAGIYPFRTLWYEGGGGADIEWLQVLSDGTRVLVNDPDNPAALKAYRLPLTNLPAYVGSVSPAAGSQTITRPKTVEAILIDAGTTVNTSGITLKLNGVNAPVTVSKTNGQTTVIHTIVGDLLPGTEYTAELTYTDSMGATQSVTWKFTTGTLSSTLFVIEAEDFNYSEDGITGGLTNPKKGIEGQDVDVMPYFGGAYDQLSAVEGVDYNNGDGNDGSNYRTELDPGGENEVSMDSNVGGAAGNGEGGTIPVAGNDRGNWRVTTSYKIGWVAGGDWQNYTRVFPTNGMNGWWKVYGGLSHGDANGTITASMDLVLSDPTQPNQTNLVRLGNFTAPDSGGWGRNNLVPMKDASGNDAVVKLLGTNTVRFNLGGGDFDFILFSAASPPPPSITVTPGPDSFGKTNVILNWVLADADTQVNTSTVKVFFDDQEITSRATVTKTDTGATISADLSGTAYAAGEHTWRLTFSDNGTPPSAVNATGTVVVNPYPTEGVFVIEAEDFNYSEDGIAGGLTNPQKGVAGMDVDVMPYVGGAYEGLSAVEGIDYNNGDGEDSNFYRTEMDEAGGNEVNITASNGNRFSNDRGTFQVTNNFRIGWVAGGDWQNYTRTFPTGTFNVWAAMSHGNQGSGLLIGSLDMVTSDVTLPDQITERLGTFNAPGTGGWGRNELVPMKTDGAISSVTMGGKQTVRFNLNSGDFDYLLFVPVSAPPQGPKFTSIRRNANGTITVEWTGGGTLEAAPTVLGPWQAVPGATSPYTFTPTPGQPMLFGRIKL